MRDETVARNYAETLFALADRHGAVQEYGDAMEMVAVVIEENAEFRLFLETPRIDDEDKKALVKKVFDDKLPKNIVNFILVTIDKRRQRILPEITTQYQLLLDERLGREHVQVAVARPVDDGTRDMIADKLSTILGKKAIPHIRVRPEIIGGLVVRTGDTIYDGSVRRRLDGMRRQLLAADLPAGTSGVASA